MFVSTAPVADSSFFLLANADGEAVTDAVLSHVALPVTIVGAVETRGDLNVFRIVPDSIKAVGQ